MTNNKFFAEFVDPFQKGSFVIHAEHFMRYVFARDYLKRTGHKADTIYDLGCGNGYGVKIIADSKLIHADRIIGFDYSESLLAIAEQLKISQALWLNVDFDKDNLVNLVTKKKLAQPDLVVAFELLEHINHPEILVKDVYTLLRPGGHLILSVPNEKYEPKKNGKSKNTFHKHLFSEAKIRNMLQAAGYKNITLYGQPKANQLYHKSKKLIRILDLLTNTLPYFFPPLAHLIAYPIRHTLNNSYSCIIVAGKNESDPETT